MYPGLMGRVYREKLARQIDDDFPDVGELYREMPASGIARKLNLGEHLNVAVDRSLYSAITMVIGGYTTTNGHEVEGQLPLSEYRDLANEYVRTQGLTSEQRSEKNQRANAERMRQNGLIPYTQDERDFIKAARTDGEFLRENGQMRRKLLTDVVNEEFHDGLPVRTEKHIANMLTQYRKEAGEEAQSQVSWKTIHEREVGKLFFDDDVWTNRGDFGYISYEAGAAKLNSRFGTSYTPQQFSDKLNSIKKRNNWTNKTSFEQRNSERRVSC